MLESWSCAEGAARVLKLFKDTYDCEPDGVWSAPGRVNLIGEHTDYNGGVALPIALPHRTFVALRRRQDRDVRLVSAQQDQVRTENLDAVGPVGSDKAVSGWAAYVLGVAWALEQAGYGPLPGFDIAVDSCVPFGAGLSSSAALECAVAVALDEVASLGLAGTIDNPDDAGRATLVEACVAAENQIAGAPTGGMDQAASLRCQAGHALLLDCRDGAVVHVPFDLAAAGLELLVIDTRAPHQLNDGQYAARRACCEAAAKTLGVEFLADVTDLDAALNQLTDPEQVKRTRHVVTEIARTHAAVAALRAGALAARDPQLAQLFDASHDSLRDDYEVTCPELDTAVETCRAHGSHGARMTGGGFGGSAIALIEPGKRAETIAAIQQAFAAAGFNPPEFLVAVPGPAAGRC